MTKYMFIEAKKLYLILTNSCLTKKNSNKSKALFQKQLVVVIDKAI